MDVSNTRFIVVLGLFLLINFGGLAIGGWLQGGGPSGEWYQSLDRAPWTPPGWVFGAAWFTIMFCFSIYMADRIRINPNAWVMWLFMIALILNVAWNPVFFRLREMVAGLIILIGLFLVISAIMFGQWKLMSWKSLLLLPYFIWLLIAISLNAYVILEN
jgi:tryptophan-rich sensory protein